MKCPLKKIKTIHIKGKKGNISSRNSMFHHLSCSDGFIEDFLDCIEKECAAWNVEDKICNYLSGKRSIKIYM